MRPKNKKPTLKVVPSSGYVLQHDLGIVVTKQGVKVYIDPEIQIVLDHILETHETVAIKINWHSKDLMLFIPQSAAEKLQEILTARSKDVAENTSIDLPKDFTPQD
jgi:hypothetical protein